jgi:predicted amidophosphoribosyltransferase
MNCNNNRRTSDDNYGDPIFKQSAQSVRTFTCSCCGATVPYESSNCQNCKKKMTSDDNYGDPIFR